MHVEGRGPAIELLMMELKESGWVNGEAMPYGSNPASDGRFRARDFSTEWVAELPGEIGKLFGLPLKVVVGFGRSGVIGSEDVFTIPLVREILSELPSILEAVERELEAYTEDDQVIWDVAHDPCIWLSEEAEDEREWSGLTSVTLRR